MNDVRSTELLSLTPRRYRWMDRVTKLLGVALIAVGLDTGGDTLAGVALAALGVTFGLATVLFTNDD